jgi:hypothetical protein
MTPSTDRHGQEGSHVQNMFTERDLEQLSEPTRSTALELFWLLRESGYTEELAIRLALRGAHEAQTQRQGGSAF